MVGSDAVLRDAPCWHCQTAVLHPMTNFAGAIQERQAV